MLKTKKQKMVTSKFSRSPEQVEASRLLFKKNKDKIIDFWKNNLIGTSFAKEKIGIFVQYKPSYTTDHSVQVVSLFDNLFEQNAYLELVNFEGEPINPIRTLYCLPYDPNWKSKYTLAEASKKPGNSTTYIVPIEDLVPIFTVHPGPELEKEVDDEDEDEDWIKPSKPSKSFKSIEAETKKSAPIEKDPFFAKTSSSLELEDCSMSAMTMRDFYAIVQNQPVSEKAWLNDLINSR